MYVIRDIENRQILESTESFESACQMLRAYVVTAPGREDDIVVQEQTGPDSFGPATDIFDLA